MEAVFVCNGPGELYTWLLPALRELRAKRPDARAVISLVPCQFAAGGEADIASTFEPDQVTRPAELLRWLAASSSRGPFSKEGGFVLSLGGNLPLALRLARKLGYPGYRYGFVPTWRPGLRRLFVADERGKLRARLTGAPASRVEVVGNLVADAVDQTAVAAHSGRPHVYLSPGSRNDFAVHLIPLFIAVVDRLARDYPEARFVWAVSSLLSQDTVAAGIAGKERATLGGSAGRRDGSRVITQSGGVIELVDEGERYAHMRAADVALTIPGTNTLELGVAGVPAVVLLPLNKPEVIPLEGPGHWLSFVPLVGTLLKRHAVRLAAPHFPVSLPNSVSGEELMTEIKGQITPERAAIAVAQLLDNPEERRRVTARLVATMPRPGAARRLLGSILHDQEV